MKTSHAGRKVKASKVKGAVTAGKGRTTDSRNKVPGPHYTKVPPPVLVKNSYKPVRVKPSKKG